MIAALFFLSFPKGKIKIKRKNEEEKEEERRRRREQEPLKIKLFLIFFWSYFYFFLSEKRKREPGLYYTNLPKLYFYSTKIKVWDFALTFLKCWLKTKTLFSHPTEECGFELGILPKV